MIKLIYTDRRGAGVIKTFSDIDQAGAVMERLRCEAAARDEAGRVVGEVFQLGPGDPGYGADGRQKWGWWTEGSPQSLAAAREGFSHSR
jgi:hypothetical protein